MMMNKIVLLCLIVVMVVVGFACSYDSPYPEDMWTQNIYPGIANTYDIGSPSHSYANGYFTNLFIAGLPVGDNVTGVGVAGRLTRWSGTSIITNATNTDAQVSGAVTNSHTQNTDIILTTNGTVALINAGVLVYDLKTDRWLHDDRNTFLGVGVAGAGNLSHTALSEGYQNTAFGCDAASSITTGYDNTVVGNDAAESMTTGYYNTIIGSMAGQFFTTEKFNTALGYQAMMNSTGGYNTAIGSGALGISGAGTYNTAVGLQAMNQGTGDRNTALGRWAGELNTGDDNVFLGNEAGQNSGAVSDKLYIDNTDTATPLIYGDFSTNTVTINDNLTVVGVVELSSIPVFANNAAAITGGLTAGMLYRTGGDPDLLCIVH